MTWGCGKPRRYGWGGVTSFATATAGGATEPRTSGGAERTCGRKRCRLQQGLGQEQEQEQELELEWVEQRPEQLLHWIGQEISADRAAHARVTDAQET